METKQVTKRFLKDYKYHNNDGYESVCFYNDKYFLKILRPEIITYERIEVINNLDKVSSENTVTPKFLLKDKIGFLGYGTKSYMDYTPLYDLVNSDINSKEEKLSFEERKEIIKNLIEIFGFFYDNRFAYYDVHEGNFLYKEGKIKIIDMDSGMFENIDSFTYNYSLRFSNRKLALLAITFLYNINGQVFDEYYVEHVNVFVDLIKKLPDQLQDLFYYAFELKYAKMTNIIERLEYFDRNIYEDTKKLLLK